MYTDEQLELIQDMTYWAMEFAVDRDAWFRLSKKVRDANQSYSADVDRARHRAELSAKFALRKCKQAGLEPKKTLRDIDRFYTRVSA